MSNKELFYFAAQCLIPDENPNYADFIRSNFTNGKINPDDFILLCDIHLILPAVYLQFKKHGLPEVFPPEYLGHLAEIYRRNKTRNLEILRQIEEINQTLAKENISPVYLKGSANLLDNLYSDNGERMIGDIDLLVSDNDFLQSADLVMKLGYRYEGKVFGDLTARKHFPRLYRPDVPADIEIHRIPVDRIFSKTLSPAAIFQDKKAVQGMTNCFVPSIPHRIVHNFIHAQLGNLGHWSRIGRLRDMHDVHLLCKNTDINEIIRLAKQPTKLKTYLALTGVVFGSPAPYKTGKNKAAGRFIRQFDWFLNHPKIHRWHIFAVKITELLFVRVFSNAGNLFRLSAWRTAIKIIADPGFYTMLSFRIKNFYANYISRL